jgi:hypothetical protein
LDGSSITNYIASFKSIYTTDKSGHSSSPTVKKDYTDIKAIYTWAGATPAMVSNMDSTNTKLGTMYRDGRVVVDGKTVGTDAWVSARFSNGSGFVNVSDGVWARKTTTSLAEASAPVIVYMQNDQMVFAAMTACDNAVKATPVKVTPPKTPTPVTPTTPVTQTPTPTPTVKTVSTTPTPVSLPNTGPGDVIGLFAGTGITGAAAREIIVRRRK